MPVADSLLWKREEAPSHTFLLLTLLSCAIRSFVGTNWRTIQFHSYKIKDADKAELDDVFYVSRTAIPALVFSLSPPAVSCLYFNPQKAKCSTWASTCAALKGPSEQFTLLFSSSPAHLFVEFTTPVFVSNSQKRHPSQPEGTELSAPGVWGLLLWNKSVRGKANCKTSSCGLDWFWLHWWKSSKTLLTYNLIRICQMRTKYCTESCTEFFLHRKLYISVPYTFCPSEKNFYIHCNTECLTILSVNHQSTIHSMNTFPINLTIPKPCQICYLNISNIKFCT